MNLFNMLNFMILIFFIGILSFTLNRFHLLMILLSLEFIVMLLYYLMIIYLNLFGLELFFMMFFLIFTVCEGVLGLSILVLMVRFNGNDYFQVLSLL
uniref:NADH dehydrogenase subunit 4L n=1 Tax=Leptocimbex linealis TaxID=2609717 RepID=UPI0022385F66|nr:NADH dehydrogenase subunit 4L [Leptocimbex linealis]UYK52114.1 NADH dehydrogenase subunit 4L [Leptocimbex linealis]